MNPPLPLHDVWLRERRSIHLMKRHPTIVYDQLSRDEVAIIAGQKNRRSDNIFRIGCPFQGSEGELNFVKKPDRQSFVSVEFIPAWRMGKARSD